MSWWHGVGMGVGGKQRERISSRFPAEHGGQRKTQSQDNAELKS